MHIEALIQKTDLKYNARMRRLMKLRLHYIYSHHECLCGEPKQRGDILCEDCWQAFKDSPEIKKTQEDCLQWIEGIRIILTLAVNRKRE